MPVFTDTEREHLEGFMDPPEVPKKLTPEQARVLRKREKRMRRVQAKQRRMQGMKEASPIWGKLEVLIRSRDRGDYS